MFPGAKLFRYGGVFGVKQEGWPGESARRDEVRQSFSGHWRKPSETLRAGLRHFAAALKLLGFLSGAGLVFFSRDDSERTKFEMTRLSFHNLGGSLA